MTSQDECAWYGITCIEMNFGAVIGRQKAVSAIDLSSNNIGGSIPADLGLLINLATIYLKKTSLTGSLSESIGQWTEIQNVDVSENQLKGTRPKSIGNWSKIWSATMPSLEHCQRQ